MDGIESVIASYQIYLKHCFRDKRSCKHTHPPISTRDDNCLYCKKYGNIFENGIMYYDQEKGSDLNTCIIPLLTKNSGNEY